MRGGEFKARALHEGQRYGEDKFVCLREFAQNARDASASNIKVHTRFRKDSFELSFEDDGDGIDFHQAKDYLFKLYTSSKEHEAGSAGRFGVGFWSVLLLRPHSIELESCTKNGRPWKVTLDGDLSTPKHVRSSMTDSGFRVLVKCKARNLEEFESLQRKAKRSLTKYCRYLRRNDKSGSLLPISFNGEPINKSFEIKGSCWTTFRSGPREGAVGLGKRPLVELYAKGLLVWRGSVLDELRYGAPLIRTPKYMEGLAPVFLLGANNLSVTLDRRAVVDDRALARLRIEAKRRMRKLLMSFIDGVHKRSLFRQIVDYISSVKEDIRQGDYNRSFAITATLISLVILGIVGASYLSSKSKNPPVPGTVHNRAPLSIPRSPLPEASPTKMTPLGNPATFLGPSVDPSGALEQVQLSYDPPHPLLFRIAVFERLHPGRGIVEDRNNNLKEAPDFVCKSSCLDVGLEINVVKGSLVLPCPTGGLVDSTSVRFEGEEAKKLYLSRSGEPVVHFQKQAKGKLTYRVAMNSHVPKRAHLDRLTRAPRAMQLPLELKQAVTEAAQIPKLDDRVIFIREFVKKRIEYDDSYDSFLAYEAFLKPSPKNGWLGFVLNHGRGDCDVKNTVAIAALRELGIPSRLAIGFIGKDGKVLPGMHAWVEYYDTIWKKADATGGSTTPSPALSAGQREPLTPSTTSEEPKVMDGQGYNEPGPIELLRELSLPIGGVAASVFVVLLVLIFILGTRSSSDLVSELDREKQRYMVAEMASSNSAFFGSMNAVARSPAFPVLGSKRGMSKKEALALSKQGMLWCSKGETKLARLAASRGARILDSSSEHFARLIERMPGIQNLDDISKLRQVAPGSLDGDLKALGDLISKMNDLLKRAGIKNGRILPCKKLHDSEVQDVDLSGLGFKGQGGPAMRFVGVSSTSKTLLENAALGRKSMGLALFLSFKFLMDKSALLKPWREEILRLAALGAMESIR